MDTEEDLYGLAIQFVALYFFVVASNMILGFLAKTQRAQSFLPDQIILHVAICDWSVLVNFIVTSNINWNNFIIFDYKINTNSI